VTADAVDIAHVIDGEVNSSIVCC